MNGRGEPFLMTNQRGRESFEGPESACMCCGQHRRGKSFSLVGNDSWLAATPKVKHSTIFTRESVFRKAVHKITFVASLRPSFLLDNSAIIKSITARPTTALSICGSCSDC